MWTALSRMSPVPLRLASGGAILGFHSITTDELPANGSAHVSLEAFEACLDVARQTGELVALSELVQRHRQGRSTAGLIAVTFDDAYAALRGGCLDAVARRQVPIAVFVVTQAAQAGAAYWWDRVDDLFPRVTPERWRAFEHACGLPEDYRRGQPRDQGPLRPLRQWTLAAHAGRWPAHREPVLQELERETGFRTVHRSMTFAELEDVARMPLVEIGVHTLSHPVLPLLSDAELQEEIAVAFAHLRERWESVLPVLAVPFGLYDERTLRAARAAGMVASLSMVSAKLRHELTAYALPRLCVTRNDTPAKLRLRLLGLPDLVRRWSGRAAPPYPDLPSATT
jgi:peptidoglycan/xylan/chitin deacetylase (PgdA/CDA1 family)